MRRKIVAGNWKMNKVYEEGRELAQEVVGKMQPSDVEVILAPPYIHLRNVHNTISKTSKLYLAAQNCHQNESGAYTGEVSVSMLKSTGVEYVIIGHSERREFNKESHELLAEKVNAVLKQGLTPIFCCGEQLPVREAGTHVEFVSKQLKDSLFHLPTEEFEKVLVAYEPVWAIGTGVTASPQQAQDMHHDIRNLLAEKYGKEVADKTPILYGGSCKPSNAKELFNQADVDGGLIGGAALKADDFIQIVNSF